MYVCICNAVTDSQIIDAQNNGMTSLQEIKRHLGVGSCCGRCVETAAEVMAENAGVKQYVPSMACSPAHMPA